MANSSIHDVCEYLKSVLPAASIGDTAAAETSDADEITKLRSWLAATFVGLPKPTTPAVSEVPDFSDGCDGGVTSQIAGWKVQEISLADILQLQTASET